MTDTDEARRAQWHLEHEDAEGLELCADCTGLLANGEYNEDYGAWESVEALTDAIDKQWPEAEGWHIDYAGCTEPDEDDTDEDDARYHIDFTWSSCDGCGSTLGGSRCQGYAWRKRRKCHACVKAALLRSPRVCDDSRCIVFVASN